VIDQLYGRPKGESGCPVEIGPEIAEIEMKCHFIDSDGVLHYINRGYTTGPPIDPELLSTIDFSRLPPERYSLCTTDCYR